MNNKRFSGNEEQQILSKVDAAIERVVNELSATKNLADTKNPYRDSNSMTEETRSELSALGVRRGDEELINSGEGMPRSPIDNNFGSSFVLLFAGLVALLTISAFTAVIILKAIV